MWFFKVITFNFRLLEKLLAAQEGVCSAEFVTSRSRTCQQYIAVQCMLSQLAYSNAILKVTAYFQTAVILYAYFRSIHFSSNATGYPESIPLHFLLASNKATNVIFYRKQICGFRNLCTKL
jgi:hypothetical protein